MIQDRRSPIHRLSKPENCSFSLCHKTTESNSTIGRHETVDRRLQRLKNATVILVGHLHTERYKEWEKEIEIAGVMSLVTAINHLQVIMA